MALTDWLPSFLTRRRDAAPVVPLLADRVYDQGATVRIDGGASVANLMTGLGASGDKGTTARPNCAVLPLSMWELRTLYAYNGVARRLINLRPGRACRRGWTLPDFSAEDARLRIPERIEQGLRWAELYGGSLVVPITLDDVPPGYRGNPAQWLTQPLDPARVQAVRAVQVFDAVEVSPVLWDRNPGSPTFRLPSLWRISCDGWQVVVHSSRVVHLRGAERPPSEMRSSWSAVSNLPDDSYLQSIWDELRRLTQTLNAGATLAEEIREAVLSLAALSERTTGDEGAAVMDQLNLMQLGRGLTGLTLIGTDDEFESKSNPPTGFKDLSDAAWEALSAATGIPQTILRGDAPSGLNTDGASGHEGFRQLVSAYQESHRYDLERLYAIVGAAQDGPTSGAGLEERTVTFAPLDEPDTASEAATRKVVAETDQIYVGMGVYTAATIAERRFGAGSYSFEIGEVPPVVDVATDAKPYQDVALPALIQAAIIGPSGARTLLGVGEELAPTPEELAALQAANAVGGAGPRADSAPDSVTVQIPAADTGIRARVEAAIGQALTVEDDPHVTVLYLGDGLSPEAVAEVVAVVRTEVAAMDPSALLEFPTLRAFPPGADGTPIVVEYGDGYAVQALNERLLRALAHRVSARQFPRYRPHCTVGYAPAPLTPEAQAALLGIDTTVDDGSDAAALSLRIPVGSIEVRVGDRVLLTAYPGVPASAPEDTPDPAAVADPGAAA